MGRKPTGRQSLNSSIVTVTNNSMIDENATKSELEYFDIVRRFEWPETIENRVKLLGSQDTIDIVNQRIQRLLNSEENRPDLGLITGPPGTGKTSAVRELAEQNKSKLAFFFLDASWLLDKDFGNPRIGIKLLFNEAVQKAPSLVFIDRIDLISSDKRSQNDANRVLNIILYFLERLQSIQAKVLVLAATDKPEVLDPQLTKAGNFSREIRFELPKKQDRLRSLMHDKDNLESKQLEEIAQATDCYSYSDLSDLRKIATEFSNEKLNYDSFKYALAKYKPVATKSITSPCPPLRWDDIGGLDEVKKLLQDSVMWELEHRDKFKKLGIEPRKGALLYGPPGCSKTMLAQALATESGFNFISIKGPEIFSKYVGDSEAAIRRLYRNARGIAPCIIFFDEFDGLATQRAGESQNSSVGDKIVTQLLTELNGIEPLDNVYTIAATNRPDRLDSPLLRPGRLYPAIYIPLPSKSDRIQIFKVHMRSMSLSFDEPLEDVIDKLATETEGYSGAEIAEVCHVAVSSALRENNQNENIEYRHFVSAVKQVEPTTNPEHLKAYEKFRDRGRKFQQVPKGNKKGDGLARRTMKMIFRKSS